MNRLDSIAMAILQGLMLRHKEQGYSDESAIHEAYRLAELVVAQKTAPNTVYTKCECSDPECNGIGYYNITCDKCGEGLIF